MKKILFVVHRYSPAPLRGSEIYLKSLAEYLSHQGFDSIIATSNISTPVSDWSSYKYYILDNPPDRVDGIKVVRLEANPVPVKNANLLARIFPSVLYKKTHFPLILKGFYLQNLEKVILEEKPDYIFVSPFLFAHVYQAYKLSRKHNIPFVLIPLLHLTSDSYRYPYIYEVIKNSFISIFLTRYEMEYATQRTNNQLSGLVIPPIINPESYSKVNQALLSEIKSKYFLEGKKIVLFEGAKRKQKGIFNLLKVMNEIKDKDVVLITLGLIYDKQKWSRTLAEYKNINLVDIDYADEDTKNTLFQLCDIFVLPSKEESFGIVYLEAMLCKKPVIAVRHKQVEDLILDNETGFLVSFGDEHELKAKIEELLGDNSKRERMGEAGHKHALKNYLSNKDLIRLEELLNTQ